MPLTLCYISHAFTEIWLLTFTAIMTREKMACFTSIMSFVAICGPFSSQMHCIWNTAVPSTRLNNFLALTVLNLCLTTQRSHRLNKECSTGPDHRCWRSFITVACAERPGSAPTLEASMWFQALPSCISDAVCTSTWFITSAGNQLVPNQ